MTGEPFRISSTADLEIAALYEGHSLLADIISPALYHVAGLPPDQQSSFHSETAFNLFAIRVGELLSEASNNVTVEGLPGNLSLLQALRWMAPRVDEPSGSQLCSDVDRLATWLAIEDPCRFWCPGLGSEFTFFVAREQLWRLFANKVKHTFLRLQQVTKQLSARVARLGNPVSGAEVLHVLDSFGEWLSGYCAYNATMVTELLGRVFASLNDVICERAAASTDPWGRRRKSHPRGASPYFVDLHSTLVAFHGYDGEKRILPMVPVTGRNLTKIYNP